MNRFRVQPAEVKGRAGENHSVPGTESIAPVSCDVTGEPVLPERVPTVEARGIASGTSECPDGVSDFAEPFAPIHEKRKCSD